jgi:hypothetical protein
MGMARGADPLNHECACVGRRVRPWSHLGACMGRLAQLARLIRELFGVGDGQMGLSP